MKSVNVVLVNNNDQEVGRADSLDAHRCPGLLHRAISIFLYRKTANGIELLITKRSEAKTRWPGYWTNPVCTHPLPDEAYKDTCIRRLKDELGIRMKKKDFTFLYRFAYQASYDGLLCENELDSVFIAERSGKLFPNPNEIGEIKWITFNNLKKDIAGNASVFTPWFQMIVKANGLSDHLASIASV